MRIRIIEFTEMKIHYDSVHDRFEYNIIISDNRYVLRTRGRSSIYAHHVNHY